MLSPGSKAKILENFFGLDFAIFKKPLDKVEVCCPILKEEYTISKGALLSIMIEMFNYLEHNSELRDDINISGLKKIALESAKISRKNASSIILSESSKKQMAEDIMKIITESSEEEKLSHEAVAESVMKKRLITRIIDDLVLMRPLTECSKGKGGLRTGRGKELLETYTLLRDNLVKSVLEILES